MGFNYGNRALTFGISKDEKSHNPAMEVWRMTHIRSFLLIAVICSAIASCVSTQKPKTIAMLPPFNASQAGLIEQRGAGSIKVQAFMRQKGGGIVTAAGNQFVLIPHSDYASARLSQLYEGRAPDFDERPYIPASDPKAVIHVDPPEYYKYTRRQTADASGSTTFKNVADGKYFITTHVVWKVGESYEGGAVYERVTVKDGEAAEVIIAR